MNIYINMFYNKRFRHKALLVRDVSEDISELSTEGFHFLFCVAVVVLKAHPGFKIGVTKSFSILIK